MNWKNVKVMVTGGAGFIGSHLAENLVEKGATVAVPYVEILPKSYFQTQNLTKKTLSKRIDITDKKKVSSFIQEFKPQYIFHLAAETIVPQAYMNPWQTFETNIMGTVNILEEARKNKNIKAVIVASSDKAYGKLKKEKYKEGDPLAGDHPYDVSKSCTDLISQTYSKTYDTPIVITRFGNVYGEGDLNFSRIIPGIMKAIIKNETLEIRSNGKYIRDYLYVKDVVQGYLLLAENIGKVKGEAFNFGSKETLSVLEVIKIAEKTLGRKMKYKILNNAKNEIPYQSLNFEKIKKIGWKPTYLALVILPSIYKWYYNIL